MRWNSVLHYKRPPASNKGARKAWDLFVDAESYPPARKRVPKELSYRFMTYWVWVMEFTNGDIDEIDALTLREPREKKSNEDIA